jgi:hypothetical protein
MHRGDKEEDEEYDERVAAARFPAHGAVVRCRHRRQCEHVRPTPCRWTRRLFNVRTGGGLAHEPLRLLLAAALA